MPPPDVWSELLTANRRGNDPLRFALSAISHQLSAYLFLLKADR